MSTEIQKSNVMNSPATTSAVRTVSPELLRNEVDRRLVKIRPMSTPLDQISRHAMSRRASSMEVEYYAVGIKEVESSVKRWVKLEEDSPNGLFRLTATSVNFLQVSETVLFPDVMVKQSESAPEEPLVVYVVRTESDSAIVSPVFPVYSSAGAELTIAPKTKFVRMGRAAAELDVQTPQFQAIPKKSSNLCQIFKSQIEQSTLLRLADKEVGWDFNDQEEAAVIDMRLGMEKSFLFGKKARFTDPVRNEEILLTGGIWNQTTHEWRYNSTSFANGEIVDMMRHAFTGNSGSKRKILIGGSDLMQNIHSFSKMMVIRPDTIVTRWGIDFTELCSKFGRLFVAHSEVFDQCGHSADGMIIDPDYITKYSHIPFRTEKLDLRSSGIRNTDAIVVTEASCLVLRYPDAHMKIIFETLTEGN